MSFKSRGLFFMVAGFFKNKDTRGTFFHAENETFPYRTGGDVLDFAETSIFPKRKSRKKVQRAELLKGLPLYGTRKKPQKTPRVRRFSVKSYSLQVYHWLGWDQMVSLLTSLWSRFLAFVQTLAPFSKMRILRRLFATPSMYPLS